MRFFQTKVFVSLFNRSAHAIGTKVSATTTDAISAYIMVKERFFIMAPVVPPMSAIGRNTATVVSVEAIIAMETSFAPISADSAAV